jgi:hypothetical protein
VKSIADVDRISRGGAVTKARSLRHTNRHQEPTKEARMQPYVKIKAHPLDPTKVIISVVGIDGKETIPETRTGAYALADKLIKQAARSFGLLNTEEMEQPGDEDGSDIVDTIPNGKLI